MNFRIFLFMFFAASIFVACDDDEGTIVEVPAVMGTIAPEVGGPDQMNQVYVDLNAKSSTVSPRSNWDFGFHNGAEFRVVLNGSNGMLAVPTDETDFSAVSSADTFGFLGGVMNTDALFGILVGQVLPPWFAETATWADDPSGDLSKTAIEEVDAVAANNKVYIVNRGKNGDGSLRGFVKILTIRNNDGYQVTYGDLDDPTGTTVLFDKDSDYNFTFLSMDNGVVEIEPEQEEWDIAFSTYTDHVLSFFVSGYPVPYVVNDFVFANRNGVRVATVEVTGDVLSEYNLFSTESLAALVYNENINAIGTDWRTVANPQIPGSITAPKSDRFYIVEDDGGTAFKVLFTQMTNDNGLRGYPEFIFEEIK